MYTKKKLQGYTLRAMHNKHIFGCTIFRIVQLLLTNYENMKTTTKLQNCIHI